MLVVGAEPSILRGVMNPALRCLAEAKVLRKSEWPIRRPYCLELRPLSAVSSLVMSSKLSLVVVS